MDGLIEREIEKENGLQSLALGALGQSNIS